MNPGISTKQIALPAAGAPQTILIIGSDHRAGEPFRDSNTDTMLLVRLNAKSSTINVMSIPRDLSGRHPRVRHRQDQRRLQRGWLRAADQDDQAKRLPQPAHQPHRRHQLHGLLGARGRHRLRLLRRRPPLLQRHGARPPTTTRASTSSPAIRSCAATTRRSPARCRSCASATWTPTSCARPASRTSSAGPRTSSASPSCWARRTGCCGSSASTRRWTRVCSQPTGSSTCSTWSSTPTPAPSTRWRSRPTCSRAPRPRAW